MEHHPRPGAVPFEYFVDLAKGVAAVDDERFAHVEGQPMVRYEALHLGGRW